MRKISIFDFMNQRKALSHLSFLIFSLLVTIIVALTTKTTVSIETFVLILCQLEVFIFLGSRLFADLNFDRSPGEITMIVAVRFTIFLFLCLLAAMILFILLQYSISILIGGDTSAIIGNFIHSGFRGWFRSTVTGLSGGALIFIVLLWQTSLKREQKLREENLIFQNETLKNQINPHFLFNSLNTLSSLIADRPEDAEKFINKLSSIYRYILENSQKDRVPLKTELDFINNYFELHKVRDKEKIVLSINTPDMSGIDIIPVSLQILIENAIKHNMTTRENPLMISITIEGEWIVIKNNLQKMGTIPGSTKLGLKNLAERVKLVSKKELIVEETNGLFIVKVPLMK